MRPQEPDEASGESGPTESQATQLIHLVLAGGMELWHSPDGDGFVSIRVGQHREHHALSSRPARDYLLRRYYKSFKKAPSSTAVQSAVATLSSMARFDGPEHEVHLRVAGSKEGVTYLDLGDEEWRAVEISRKDWRVVNDPAVRFRRTRGLRSLPDPTAGGSLAELREFLNVATDEDFALAVTWLLQALRPVGPYPVLVLLGEQGSAKSTTERVLRRLVDPNHSDVRAEPREARDLAVAADNGHVIALDNISRLPEWLSDALCRVATGGGFSTRTLYENRDEEIFEAQRPVILNGIAQVATRPDLIDRAIVLTLPVIRDRHRRNESHFWAAFEAARPRLLGALLDAIVVGLGRYQEVQLEALPRMADFATWGVAVEPACPWRAGSFLAAFDANRKGSIESVLDGDPIVDVVRALAPWTGTASDLLAELNRRTPEGLTKRRDGFSTPRQVSDQLRRLTPGLRRVGIEVNLGREGGTGRRTIAIRQTPWTSSPSSQPLEFKNNPIQRSVCDEGDHGDVAIWPS